MAEMKPIRVWAVSAKNHSTGLFTELDDAEDDALDLQQFWRKKPTIVQGWFVPAVTVTPRKRRKK